MDSMDNLGVEDVLRFADVTSEEGGWLVVSAMENLSMPVADAVSFQSLSQNYEGFISEDDLPLIEDDLTPEDVVRLLFLTVDNTPTWILQKCVVKMNQARNSKNMVDSFSEWVRSTTEYNWKPLFLEGLAVIGRLDILDTLGLNEEQIRRLQHPVNLSSLKVSLNRVCYSLRQAEMSDLVRYISSHQPSGHQSIVFPDGVIIKQLLELYILFWMQEGIMDLTNLSILADALVHIHHPELKDILTGNPPSPSSQAPVVGSASQQGEHSKVISLKSVGDLLDMPVMYPSDKGVCVIFNQEQFVCANKLCGLGSMINHGARLGSSHDANSLQKLFVTFQCQTKIFVNLKSAEIELCLNKLATAHDLGRFDYLVCCFLSHGGTDAGRQYVYGSDCDPKFVDELVSPFEGNRCAALRGKMKIVITQSCQGDGTLPPVESDGPSDTPPLPRSLSSSSSLQSCATALSDFLFCQATTPGFKAFRDPRRGSFYIQRLCEVLERRGYLEEVTLCIKDVHNLLIQTPVMLGKQRCSIQPQMIDRTRGRFRFKRSEQVPPQAG